MVTLKQWIINRLVIVVDYKSQKNRILECKYFNVLLRFNYFEFYYFLDFRRGYKYVS